MYPKLVAGVVCLNLCLLASRAAAVVVPVAFEGSNQSIAGEVPIDGSLHVGIVGAAFVATKNQIQPFVTTPPIDHPLTLVGGPLSLALNPISMGLPNPPQPTTFNISGGQIQDISNLDLDLLHGNTIPFAFEPVIVTTNSAVSLLKNISIELSAEITSLTFIQTGPATLVPTGVDVGTFSIPGEFAFFSPGIDVLVAGLLGYTSIPYDVHNTAVLAGTYSMSGPQSSKEIALDGTAQFAAFVSNEFPYDTELVSPQVTLHASVSAALAASFNFGFHLQTAAAVPEPGSIVLLAIGLLILPPALWRIRKSARAG